VAHDNDPVGRKVDVKFQPVRTGAKATLERGDRVFWTKRAAASMGKDSRARPAFEEGHD
jgi:hypothetical protein